MKLDARIKELIAIGASVTANCQPCLQYHISKAVEHGSDDEELAVAIAVAKAVRRGASAKMDDFASGLTSAARAEDRTPSTDCGCSAETGSAAASAKPDSCCG